MSNCNEPEARRAMRTLLALNLEGYKNTSLGTLGLTGKQRHCILLGNLLSQTFRSVEISLQCTSQFQIYLPSYGSSLYVGASPWRTWVISLAITSLIPTVKHAKHPLQGTP